MKLTKYVRIIFALSSLVIVPLHAHADDWDNYLDIVNNYYTLNRQDFKSISCHIEVPIINNSLTQLRSQLKQLEGKIAITDDLASFNLTYSKQKGLAIHYPSLDVRIISGSSIKDRANVEKGIGMVKAGFNLSVEGVAQQLEGFFEGFGYQVPKKSDYRMKEVKNNNGIYTVKYEKKEGSFTEIYSRNQRKVTQIGANGERSSSVEKYDRSTDGKLVLTDAHYVADQAQAKMEGDVSISYKRIENLNFPAHIATRIKQSMQTIKTEGQVDIYLEDCTVR
jgi:hypothetical protein